MDSNKPHSLLPQPGLLPRTRLLHPGSPRNRLARPLTLPHICVTSRFCHLSPFAFRCPDSKHLRQATLLALLGSDVFLWLYQWRQGRGVSRCRRNIGSQAFHLLSVAALGRGRGDGLCWVSPKQNRKDDFLYIVVIPLGFQPKKKKKSETSHDILETQ